MLIYFIDMYTLIFASIVSSNDSKPSLILFINVYLVFICSFEKIYSALLVLSEFFRSCVFCYFLCVLISDVTVAVVLRPYLSISGRYLSSFQSHLHLTLVELKTMSKLSILETCFFTIIIFHRNLFVVI